MYMKSAIKEAVRGAGVTVSATGCGFVDFTLRK